MWISGQPRLEKDTELDGPTLVSSSRGILSLGSLARARLWSQSAHPSLCPAAGLALAFLLIKLQSSNSAMPIPVIGKHSTLADNRLLLLLPLGGLWQGWGTEGEMLGTLTHCSLPL